MWPFDREKDKIEELGWTIVALKQEIASLKAAAAKQRSADIGDVVGSIEAMDSAFERLEAGGYSATHMLAAMQQTRNAVTDLAYWANGRRDNDPH